MPILDEVKDRAIRLIDYLTELARLRTKIVRDIKEYQSVLWIHEIPREPQYCFTQAWGVDENFDLDVWIEIRKYEEPILDEVPEICKEWVNNSTLSNTEGTPELFSSISIQVKVQNQNEDPDSTEQEHGYFVNKTMQLVDHPAVSEAWKRFVKSKWDPWADLHRRWQSVQNVYAKLFEIHQEQQKLGEEYELVVGLGFLKWNTPTGQSVRRHLLVARATLTFEARLGKFMVTPAADGAQLTVELDMLDIEDQPRNARQTANEGLVSANDNPWDRSSIDPVLMALANSLADQGQGEYHNKNLAPTQGNHQTKPIVDYAPTLILRKRSVRGLEQTLHEMRNQIDEGCKIPPEFIDLCEGEVNREHISEGHEQSCSESDQTIYFPKPSNEEQLQIVQKLRSISGVLVQGPPGTGKSHTIANLICHLLATGQRVLVTAKTPRALQVLHGKLPPQLQPLCINLLGSGIEEQKSLEASVHGILNKQDGWNENRVEEKINELNESMHQLKSEKAEIDYRIRSIRESETFKHSIIDGMYRGTAAKIALQLQKESSEFNWLRDNITYDTELPISPDDLMNLHIELSRLTPELDVELQLLIPDPERDLPPQEKFEVLVSHETEAEARFSSLKPLLNSQLGRTLERAERNHIQDIIDSVAKLIAAVDSISNRPMPWIKKAIYDMLTDNDTPWKELLSVSFKNLVGLKERARKIDNQTLVIPDDIDRKKLLLDAKALKHHFDEGGKIGWWLFKPKIIREHRYLFDKVNIDGHLCNSSENLEMVIEYLSVEQKTDYGWKLWESWATRSKEAAFVQVAELEELQEALTNVVSLYALLESSKESIRYVQALGEPRWYDSKVVHELLDTCRAVISKYDLLEIQEDLNQYVSRMQSFAKQPHVHLVAKEVLSIFKNRETDKYSNLLNRIYELRKLSERAKWAKRTLNELFGTAPILAKELSANPKNEEWVIRFRRIQQAWSWARSNSWLKDFLKKEDIQSLERRSKQIDDDIKICLTEISAIRAWKFCFSRMEESHRRHLMGWQQAIRRVGKGTGKHAPKHRRTAQEHLNKCRDAVPSWIMPLHRVYETVRPAPGIFDVIIVDEASQCGPESLPLAYLSKRLLVVGDEQQISPEAVGIDRAQIHRLMDEYLSDFEHADSFDVESSLFDHGKRRFGNRIVLREHFRCVPEIIRFSNDLSYHATPLIALRQYPPQRLEPLKRVHVVKGYREGSDSKAINRSEAEELVKVVLQCCEDERYNGKTMGVIILQGNAQAAIIENMLLEQLGAEEMELRRLICGNPYSFQGDERHIIFLSMVAAPNKRIGPFTRPADQRRFNVSASRAQDQMWLFHTATCNDLSKSCLRWRLLEFFENPISQITKALGEEAEKLQKLAHTANRQIEKPPKPYDSWFEVDVALKIASKGYRVIPQYPFANKKIDLVIEGTKSQLAVECDGDEWHGLEQYEKDMERQRILERCGWRFHRIRECMFNANPEESLISLWQELENLGIKPVSETTTLT